MGNHKKRVLKKRIKRMILLPVLIALILFCVGEIATKKVKESQTGGSASETAAASDLTRERPKQAGEGNSTGSEPIQGNESVTAEAGAETFGEIPAPEPMQKIAFTAADSGRDRLSAQRSVPVQIDSSILGGELKFLRTIVFILVIAALVQLVEIVLKRYIPSLHKSLGVYLPLITTNCAVLGVTILNITEDYDFLQSMVNSLGSGLGFFLAMVMFSGVRSKIEGADIPESFKGLPVTLIAASITSLSFLGFGGVVENMFPA